MAQRVAVVTGAASGIGLAIAESLAAKDYRVVMADVNIEEGQQQADRLGAYFVHADLTDRTACRDLISAAIAEYGSIDVLVNNAGVQHVSPIENFPEDKWDFIIRLMLTAPFLLTRYAWPHMQEAGWGRVINISSVHGIRASEYKSAYISAKHGLMGLTKSVNKSVQTVVHVPVEDSAATAAATSSRGTPSCGVILKQARRSVSLGV